MAITRLSTQMSGLRDGSGTLATAMRRIDPELLAQMSGATDTATVLNLLAQAYVKAGDAATKNALAQAAFGRGGGAMGGLLVQIADKGTVDGVVESVGKLDLITQQQISSWKKLKIEIDADAEAAKNNIASIYTTTVLQYEKSFYSTFLDLSRELKTFSLSDDYKTFAKSLTLIAYVASLPGKAVSAVSLKIASANATIAARPLTNNPDSLTPSFSPMAPSSGDESAGLNMSKQLTQSIGNEAAAQKLLIAALGSAATASELLKDKQLALSKAYEDGAFSALGKVGSAEAKLGLARAQAALNLESAIAATSAYTSALGASTPISELVYQKGLQLQALQLKNPKITNDQIEFQKQLTASQALGTFQIDAQTAAEKVKTATLFMSTEAGLAYSIVQTKINEAKALGNALTADQIAKEQKSADAFAKTKVQGDTYTASLKGAEQAATSFADSLVHGLASGADAAATLISSLQSLGQSLQSIGVKSAMSSITDALKGGPLSFDPVSLGIGAAGIGISAITALIGKDSAAAKALQEAQLAWKNMSGQVTNFNLAAAGTGAPLVNALQKRPVANDNDKDNSRDRIKSDQKAA